MPETKKYSQKVHNAYKALQEKDGMTNKNVTSLQSLLKYYPENNELSIDGNYGEKTINAINSFYKNHYWTEDRKMQALKDKYGEKYIMESEMDAMLDYKKNNPNFDN